MSSDVLRSLKLRVLNKAKHEEIKRAYEIEITAEDNLYITYANINSIQEAALEYAIETEVYRICGDDEYNFKEITTTNKHNYKSFEDFYEQHKADTLSADSSKRESKRVHEGISNVIRMLSRKTKCNNNTAITTMLLQYGAYCFYNEISKDEFDIIRQYFDKYALSAFDHDTYFEGGIALSMLTSPITTFRNSRAVILDITRPNKVVHLYPNEFVFKTLEDLSLIGFDGKSAIHGIELLISLAFSESDILKESYVDDKICKLSSPTIKQIKSIIESDWIDKV